MPRSIGMVVSAGKATFHELDSVLSVEDVYDLLEVITIDAHNRRILNKREQS